MNVLFHTRWWFTLLFFVLGFVIPVSVFADNGHYLIDFGDAGQLTSDTGWNNSYFGNVNFTLIDSAGDSSDVTIQITAGTPAYNANGTTASGPYPVSAQRDSSFVSDVGFAGSTNSITYRLSNLDSDRVYTFTFYASRDAVADTRSADYTIGATSVTLNASNNINNVVTIEDVAPTSGQISFTLDKATTNDNGSGFAYLGVVEVTSEMVADPPTVSTNAASSVTDTTATLNGQITVTGGSDATESGFAYGTSATLASVIATSTRGAQSGTASFTQNLTSLTPETTYYFRAYATNTAGTGYGAILSFTTGASNDDPVADAGSNQSITLPTHSVTLTGSGTDSDGTISSYLWEETTSGASRIISSTTATTQVTDLAAGVYTFRLTVTDNENGTGTDTVNVTVASSTSTTPPRKVVVIGSSTAAAGGATTYSSSWVGRFTTYLQSLNASNSVVNLAVIGYSTYQAMPTGSTPPDGRPSPSTTKNITAALAEDPDGIIINLPSNDAAGGYSLAETISNFDTITDLADAAGVPVWVTTSQPRNLDATGRQKLMDTRDWVNETYGEKAIDFWTTIAESDGTIVDIYDQGDGIHVLDPAHQIFYNRVAGSGFVEDMYVAPAISSVVATPSNTSATLSWTTNEAASSQVVYSPVSTLISSSTLAVGPVTSHSVNLTGLSSCTKYHYRVRSADVSDNTTYSSSGTFNTTGCTGSAAVTNDTSGAITSAGGSLNLLSGGNGITLTVPASYKAGVTTAYFQIQQLNKSSFLSSASSPSGKTVVGDYIYHLVSLPTSTTTITSFDQPLTVTFEYDDSDVPDNVTESTLAIYRYDGSTWNVLTGCSVDDVDNIVSCTTTSFSDFALFGTTPASSASSSSGGRSGQVVQPRTPVGGFRVNHEVVSGGLVKVSLVYGSDITTFQISETSDMSVFDTYNVAPMIYRQQPKTGSLFVRFCNQYNRCSPVVVSSNNTQQQSGTDTGSVTGSVFNRNLSLGMTGSDVLALQKYLNAQGYAVAMSGPGSVGNETEYFGVLTRDALIRFQNAHASAILAPVGISYGTGFFGPSTRAFVRSQ